MNSSVKREEPLRAVITIEITSDDYKDEYKTRRNKLARDAKFPGFRPGKVPTSLIEKRFGAGLKAEVVNDTLNKELMRLADEEKLHLFGQPLLINEKELSFDADPITFIFHAALRPEVNIPLDKSIELPYYTSTVSEASIDKEDQRLRDRNRTQIKPESVSVEAKDMLIGKLTEVEPEEGQEPVMVEKTYLMPSMMKNKAGDAFEGKKVGDIVRYNPFNAAEGNEQELASTLRLDKEKAVNHKGDFDFTIEEISRSIAPELGEEYYKKCFGESTDIKEETSYRNKLKELIEESQKERANTIFENQLQEVLKERLGNPELDKETLMKVFFKEEELEKLSKDEVEKRYNNLTKALLHTTLIDETARNNDIKVEQEEISKYIADMTWRQLLQYGIPPEMIGQFGQDFLKRNLENEEMIYNAHYSVLSRKLAEAAKERISVKEESLSEEDFEAKFNEILAAQAAEEEDQKTQEEQTEKTEN